MQSLVQASYTTRSWLSLLRKHLGRYIYRESKYYASFRLASNQAAVAYLNPSKTSIRLFLPLQPDSEKRLNPTPSTSNWAERFPSVVTIESESDVPLAAGLIEIAAKGIMNRAIRRTRLRRDYMSAEEITPDQIFVEGAKKLVQVNAFERSARGRAQCIEHYGASCLVCGFNFEAVYGLEGAGFIHVHHVVPLSTVGRAYRLDPVKDLVPVCANCHSMIHRRDPPFTVEEVKAMLCKDI